MKLDAALASWILAYKGRSLKTHTTLREQFYSWLLTPDSFMAAIGWATWMGLFGGLVSFSITGQTMPDSKNYFQTMTSKPEVSEQTKPVGFWQVLAEVWPRREGDG